MRKLILMAVMLLPFFLKAQQAGYSLTATFSSLKLPAKAYLIYDYGWTDQKIVDSAMLLAGSFQFKGKIAEPQKVSLLIDHQGSGWKGWNKSDDVSAPFYLEQGLVLIKGTDSAKRIMVKAGAVNAEYVKFKAEVMSGADKLNKALEAEYRMSSQQEQKNPDFAKSMFERSKKIDKETDSLKAIFIKNNPNSYISLVALNELFKKKGDISSIGILYKSLSAVVRNTPLAKTLENTLYDNGPTSVGKMAPLFTQSDVNGKPVQLSDFKGKYVLLDFWASWCGPCRAENPNVLKAYNHYKDKNFTVIGVSLDREGKKADWLAAIESDGLPWTQVSDLQFWNNAVAKKYEIRAIPQNFLIDPSGKIIAKNLRGEALEQKLSSILK
jgi:peroxiredoxin